MLVKLIYSEKATKFCEISTVDLTVTTQDKSTVDISLKFVAFSEYMNFIVTNVRSQELEEVGSWYFSDYLTLCLQLNYFQKLLQYYVFRELSLHYSFPVTIFLHSFLLKTEIIGQTILFQQYIFFYFLKQDICIQEVVVSKGSLPKTRVKSILHVTPRVKHVWLQRNTRPVLGRPHRGDRMPNGGQQGTSQFPLTAVPIDTDFSWFISILLVKGQLISKCFFGVFQKTNENKLT